MTIRFALQKPEYADGTFIIGAKGALIAVLSWANADGALPDWTPFAYVPLDPYGNGEFQYSGQRAIPLEATGIHMRCIASDFRDKGELISEIPKEFLPKEHSEDLIFRASILTDFHLSGKPWKTRQALLASESDIIFLLGDLTNDGLPMQLDIFRQSINELVPNKTIFPIPGNHDVPLLPEADREKGYDAFQREILSTSCRKEGFQKIDADDFGDYCARRKEVNIIGLRCVSEGKRVVFPNGKAQLQWFENCLNHNDDALWQILLCHAPLLAHNPQRAIGEPYLSRDHAMRGILEQHHNIIYLSGHTHFSPNALTPSVEFDNSTKNVYANCGSIVPTQLKGNELLPSDWTDGIVTELALSEREISIRAASISRKINFSRGYYRWHIAD